MPYVARNQVSLRFFGENLDPDEISRLLECEADNYYRKGDRRTRDGDPYKMGYWGISSPNGSGEILNSLVADLLLRVSQDGNIWDDLTSRFSADLFIGSFLDTWNEGIVLTPEVVAAIGDRSLSIHFDIYAVGEDEE